MDKDSTGLGTSEHILPLPIQYASSRLQILRFQPLRQRQRPGIRRAGCNRHLLPLLPLHLRLPLWLRGLVLSLLLRHLLLALVIFESLLFELDDVLVET